MNTEGLIITNNYSLMNLFGRFLWGLAFFSTSTNRRGEEDKIEVLSLSLKRQFSVCWEVVGLNPLKVGSGASLPIKACAAS